MQGMAVTTLHIDVTHTTVTCRAASTPGTSIDLAIGYGKTASDFFKHAPPTPLEMENAIMAVEDEVIRSLAVVAPGTTLRTSDAAIRDIARLAGVTDSDSMVLSVDAVEGQFDLLAALVLGRPAASAGIPADTRFAATLLILREFMHHLRFESILIEGERGGH